MDMAAPESPDLQNLFTCPIALDLFRDPVLAADGHLYEREALREALAEEMRRDENVFLLGEEIGVNCARLCQG